MTVDSDAVAIVNISPNFAHVIRRRMLDRIMSNGLQSRARVIASVAVDDSVAERLLNGLIGESIVETDGRNCWIADLPSIPLHDVVMRSNSEGKH